MQNYLPLTEYSSKYRVSVSTLRRRIKAEDIQYVFEDGRYLILDEPVGTHQGHTRPSLNQTSEDSLVGVSSKPEANPAPAMGGFQNRVAQDMAPGFAFAPQEPVLTAANRLLTELKKAYTQILQEKEEQILYLKDEVADLKTLVRVLENDNERLAKKGDR